MHLSTSDPSPARTCGPLRTTIVTIAATCTLASAPPAARQLGGELFDGERFLEHVKFLTSDTLAGRANGSDGLERAGDYIARRFDEAGLRPGGERGSYFQPFEIGTGLEIERGNRLTIVSGGQRHTLTLGRDYFPLSIDSLPRTAGVRPPPLESLPFVFAGYGISAPDRRYDDYANIDVRGAAVLIFMHEPGEQREASPFRGAAPSEHAAVRRKAAEARQRGARLLLVVEDPSHGAEATRYEHFLDSPQVEELGIAMVRVRRSALEGAVPDLDLAGALRQIDETRAPASRRLDTVRVDIVERYARNRRQVRNVIGVLEGADRSLGREAIVLGAHYDHLGIGDRFSLAPGAAGEIHNGADDNASGTAALIEVARAAVINRRDFPRTLVFVAFAGEEIGLRGSAFYISHPPVAIERTVAMLNLDMIGRANGRLLLSGLAHAPELEDDVRAASRTVSLRVEAFSEGPGDGSSDDSSFLARRVPAIGFFSGFHDDYHRPTDDWERLDVNGSVEIMRLALELTRRIAVRTRRAEFR